MDKNTVGWNSDEISRSSIVSQTIPVTFGAADDSSDIYFEHTTTFKLVKVENVFERVLAGTNIKFEIFDFVI